MDNTIPDSLAARNETVLCAGMFNGPRLTPTGKISHAKTRVYTQRYRKEWEQMPDFKGWLTSVPFQATRAFCTYCNKNLHAHRLSLLKHTCTMKHQRAALMHQNEMNSKQAAAVKIAEIEAGYEEEGDMDSVVRIVEKGSDHDAEDEEYEYVVERLDMDDDDIDDSRSKRDEQDGTGQEEDEDYEEESIEQRGSMDEDDPMPVNKKIKIEKQDENCRDTLAEAMAHVHGEYLDIAEDQGDVELEMVVTSEEGAIQESEHDASMSVIETADDDNNDHESSKRQSVKSSAEGDSSEVGSEPEVVPTRLLKVGRSYQQPSNSGFKASTMNIVGSSFNAVPSSSGQTKTFKLNTGGTVTIRPGTQYIVSNVKGGNHQTILMAERKSGVQGEVSIQKERIVSGESQQGNSIAGTSQQSSGQKPVLKSEATNKPCISTHVMDTSKGLPIGGLQVSLYKLMNGRWTFLNESNTAANGRCTDLVDSTKSNFTAGRYKIHFDVDKYFTLRRIETMYPFIEIVFDVKNPTGNYHIPVLLSPFGYTTYRGSDR